MMKVPGAQCSAQRVCQFAILSALLLFPALTATAAEVRAYVQPTTARPNQQIAYVITVQDGQVQSVPNLRFPLQIGQTTAVSTSQQFSITNGRQTSSIRLTWGISASEPGEFIIPPQDVVVNGQVMKTNEVKLIVEQGGTAFPSPGNPGANGTPEANEPILQIELGKKEIYQGEVMPVSCSLYVPRQTQLRRIGLIDIAKSDFAIARFPQQSEQTMTAIDGVGYTVLTFRSTLSSLRTGDLMVGPATLELLVEVPIEDGGQRRQMFPPGFPQAFFGAASEPRKMVVKSQQVTLKVLPLPAEGKPANFSGAVGDFALSASATPTDLTVGDPVSVELVVEGSGNFDALTTPSLVSTGGWKLYPAKRYNIEGQLDQNQMPTLERKMGYSQVLVPEAVHPAVPPFEFSFFSPAQKRYVTLRTEPIPLTMRPSPVTASTSEAAPGTGTEIAPIVADPQADITDILMNPPATSRWVAPTGVLLVRSRIFWTAQAVPVGMLVLACVIAFARRHHEARLAGRAGALRTAWADLEQGGLDDHEFLRRSAQFIHTAQAGLPVADGALKSILDRYEATNFAVAPAGALSNSERRDFTQTLGTLFRQSLAKLSVIAMMLLLGALHAQEVPRATAATPDDIYRDAITELEKGSFTRAQYLAESLTKKQPPQLSPEVFEIIGHSRYRQGDMGRAALWYQRAQLFDARSPELRQNLRHLHERTRFLSFGGKSPLTEWSYWLTPNEWVLLAAGGAWLVFLSLSWRVLSGRRSAGWPVVVSVVGLLIAVPASAFAALRPPGAERVEGISIVTQPDASSYTAATVTSGSVIPLPPGSQVRTLEKRGSWLYVEIPGQPENLRGWVEAGAVTPLWIWDAALVP